MKPGLSLFSKILLAAVIPFALAYYFLVLPSIKDSAQLNHEVESLRNATVAASSVKQREALRQQIEEVRTKAITLLPATDEQYDLSVQVEALAKSEGVTLTSLGINAAQQTNLPKTTPAQEDVTAGSDSSETKAAAPAPSSILKVIVSVGVTGSYDQIQAFVGGLTRLDRFMQVESFQLSQVVDGAVSAQVTANAYYLPAQN